MACFQTYTDDPFSQRIFSQTWIFSQSASNVYYIWRKKKNLIYSFELYRAAVLGTFYAHFQLCTKGNQLQLVVESHMMMLEYLRLHTDFITSVDKVMPGDHSCNPPYFMETACLSVCLVCLSVIYQRRDSISMTKK